MPSSRECDAGTHRRSLCRRAVHFVSCLLKRSTRDDDEHRNSDERAGIWPRKRARWVTNTECPGIKRFLRKLNSSGAVFKILLF